MTHNAAPAKIATRSTRKSQTTNKPPRTRVAAPNPPPEKTASSKPKSLPLGKLASVLLSDIVVGERSRRFVGNLASLARSIAETGMLDPILVDSEMRLVHGHRRLLAAQTLGFKRVPVLAMDLEDPLLAYVAASGERKKLTASEKYAVAEELLEKAQDPAWRERALGGRLNAAVGNGRLDEFVAGHVQLSRETLRKIRRIHESAREDEERFADLARALDADGRVDRHFRELQRRLSRGDQAAALAIVLEPSWTSLLQQGSKALAAAVRSANPSAFGDAGCLLLVPAPLMHIGSASQIVVTAGFRWVSTLAGIGDEAWALGILGRGTEIPSDVAELLTQGCVQGAHGVSEALEASFGVPPLEIALGQEAPL